MLRQIHNASKSNLKNEWEKWLKGVNFHKQVPYQKFLNFN